MRGKATRNTTNERSKHHDYNAAMQLADREICEALNGPNLNTQQKYFEAYAGVHELKYGEKFAPYRGNSP